MTLKLGQLFCPHRFHHMKTCQGMMTCDDMMTCHHMVTCHHMLTCRRMATHHHMMKRHHVHKWGRSLIYMGSGFDLRSHRGACNRCPIPVSAARGDPGFPCTAPLGCIRKLADHFRKPFLIRLLASDFFVAYTKQNL